MRNIFIFIIFANFSSLFAHTLPNNVILDCNLPAPTNLHSVEIGPGYATMAWDAVPGAVGYYVSWYNESGVQVNSETTLDTEYEVQGLESGKTYNFRVASVCSNGGTGTIYSTVVIVPIVVELLVSTDNPLGNLVETCSQVVNPVAECTLDFTTSTTYIGKIKLIDVNQVYYFRVRYSNYESKEETSKVLLDMIKPRYYPETPVPNPKLFTEYGDSTGLIHLYGSGRKQKKEFIEIKTTRINDLSYKILVFNMIGNNNKMEFSISTPNTFSTVMGEQSEENTMTNSKSEDQMTDNIKHITILNLTGSIVNEIETDLNEEYYHSFSSELPSGIYILRIRQNQSIRTKKIMINSNY
jgi:hypothetical protein